VPPLRGRREDDLGRISFAFENLDAPAHGVTRWSQLEVQQLLRHLYLPDDSPLSVLCVEMMPTLARLRTPLNQAAGGAPDDDREDVRPLSDGLGHFRILRTSPLTAVPPVCS
jgi:hypothetical protein